ncbi:zinc-dependent peptidase [Algoriphagus sp.]|uniref:zinc-dependent peptidase n=1 Tax=Algoriphagus sp. TaxID=1872435 RepID=UPI002635F5EB|nr:zinc-dependent peptidase [Algoriphagus sp.]
MPFSIQLVNFFTESIYRLGLWLFRYRLSHSEIETLQNLSRYYQVLKPEHQKEFRGKLSYILTTKKFIPRGGLTEITSEMKILIGATIVQVTFGLPRVSLSHFSKILVYPDRYISTISQAYHRGEVNPRLGIIVLSWPCFIEGFIDETDGINLGIHEVAHALKLENRIRSNDEFNFLNPQLWRSYEELAQREMNLIQTGGSDFFRKRGAENEHEFFAVALENFFERPEQFKAKKPELYSVLVNLLIQDPIFLKSARRNSS